MSYFLDRIKRIKFLHLIRSTLVTAEEWFYFTDNYEHDVQISVTKRPIVHDEGEDENNLYCNKKLKTTDEYFVYDFEPKVCYDCIAQNEMDKCFFENKKIIIRQVDDEERYSDLLNPQTNNENEDVIEIVLINCSFARFSYLFINLIFI